MKIFSFGQTDLGSLMRSSQAAGTDENKYGKDDASKSRA
jgi:hypothetical protein